VGSQSNGTEGAGTGAGLAAGTGAGAEAEAGNVAGAEPNVLAGNVADLVTAAAERGPDHPALLEPARGLVLSWAGLDAAELPPQDLPDEALVYTLPSRFCPSQEIANDAWSLFGSIRPGWSRVQAICDWVHTNIRFQYGTSTPLTTALDIYEQGVGVCRDFTQLAITFCRAMNIPTRYVFGYIPDIGVPLPDDPMDFCAWMEVYLSGRWWTFDPRNNTPRVGRVLIGRGRDALDVAMVTSYGSPLLQQMIVWADEATADGTVITPVQVAKNEGAVVSLPTDVEVDGQKR